MDAKAVKDRKQNFVLSILKKTGRGTLFTETIEKGSDSTGARLRWPFEMHSRRDEEYNEPQLPPHKKALAVT